MLLVLDTFKAYKEVLYHSVVNNLPDNVIIDVQFHHYNIDVFKTIINNGIGKYYKYVVMNFDHRDIAPALLAIASDKLLLIDWNIQADKAQNYVFQDFGKAFYESLTEAVDLFKKYKKIQFVYPDFTNHPWETVEFFKKFCADFGFEYDLITDPKKFNIEKNCLHQRKRQDFRALFGAVQRERLRTGKRCWLFVVQRNPDEEIYIQRNFSRIN